MDGSKTMNKVISVIVPVYNVEQYLRRAIESVLRQTYQDLEIILVDDGSPDACGNICDEYKELDSRIIVIHKANGGLSSARNAGLDIATGDYIAFLDSDDVFLPEMLEELLQLAESREADIVQCGFFRFSNEIKRDNYSNNIECLDSLVALQHIDEPVYMAAWNKLYRRKLFADIQFPDGKIHEDVGCTYKLFYQSSKIVYLHTPLYGYYVNRDSITTSKIKLNKLDLLDAYENQILFFEEKGLSENLKRASNNFVASFGTLLSYQQEKYEDYTLLKKEIQKRFIKKRYLMLHLPLRVDLKLAVWCSFGNVSLMKLYHKIKLKF